MKTIQKCASMVDGEQKEMSMAQINMHLIQRASVICEYVREKRTGLYTSDILPPICYVNNTLYENIESVLACFSNTLAAALHSEIKHIEISKNFETLSCIVDDEKYLIFDFLNENGLTERFNEFVKKSNKAI